MSDRHIRRNGNDYGSAFLTLLPQGQAWPKSPGTTLERACRGLAEYWGEVDRRAADLLEQESDPRYTLELLPDWERNWGLPDPCYTAPQTIGERHAELLRRMTMLGAQSRDFFIDLAASLGYDITITEYQPFVVGLHRCGDSRVYGDGSDPMYNEWGQPIKDPLGNNVANAELSDWPHYGLGPMSNRFYWTVHVNNASLIWFRVGSGGGQTGVDPHLRIGTFDDLECLLNRWKPGHTQIIFDYSGLSSPSIAGTLFATETADYSAMLGGGVTNFGTLLVTEPVNTAAFVGKTGVFGSLARTETSDAAVFTETGLAVPEAITPVIFTDDYGADTDGVAAMGIMNVLADLGLCEILAVCCAAPLAYGASAMKACMTYSGRGAVPIGAYQGSEYSLTDTYAEFICDKFYPAKPVRSTYPTAIAVMRQALVNSAGGVVLIEAGPPVNTRDLLASTADAISPLTGVQLVAAKCARLVQMGGGYPGGASSFNFVQVANSQAYVIANCPVPITFVGDEVSTGVTVSMGSSVGDWTLTTNPYRYGTFNGAVNVWDPYTVYVAIAGIGTDFALTRGTCAVNSAGTNTWTNSPTGPHHYVTKVLSNALLTKKFNELFHACYPAPTPSEKTTGSNLPLVWHDEFDALSLRTNGPTHEGLKVGSGAWSGARPWYGTDARGVEGYGMDWFVDPDYPSWPGSYPATGQFAITPSGLRIRSEQATSEMAAVLPPVIKGYAPWMSGLLMSWHGVKITPPFYFECRAKMPVSTGAAWPAIWLMTGAKEPWPDDVGKDYEIDVHEGFGDSTNLHSTLHWHTAPDTAEYLAQTVVSTAAGVNLSADFNTWGCHVTATEVIFYFNGVEKGRTNHPAAADYNQPFGILLDVAAGLPWVPTPPSGGPHDMIVRYVRLYAPTPTQLTITNAPLSASPAPALAAVPSPSISMDFERGVYTGASLSNLTCVRAVGGTAKDLAGNDVAFSANQLRITDRGLWVNASDQITIGGTLKTALAAAGPATILYTMDGLTPATFQRFIGVTSGHIGAVNDFNPFQLELWNGTTALYANPGDAANWSNLPISVSMGWNGSHRKGARNAGAVVSDANPMGNHTAMRLGQNVSGAENMIGFYRRIDVWNTELTDDQLGAITRGLGYWWLRLGGNVTGSLARQETADAAVITGMGNAFGPLARAETADTGAFTGTLTATGWPDEASTGPRFGGLTASGDRATTGPGQTISGFKVTGNISLNHANCIVEDCEVDASGQYRGIEIHAVGCKVRYCKVYGRGGPDGANAPYNQSPRASRDTYHVLSGIEVFDDVAHPNAEIHHCEIYGVENAVSAGEDTWIHDNYIHDFAIWEWAGDPDHTDGLQTYGHSGQGGLIFEHNYVKALCTMGTATPSTPVSGSSCVALSVDMHDLQIINNYLYGGSEAIYGNDQAGAGSSINTVITGNKFSNLYGVSDGFTSTDSGFVWSGNTYIETGGTVPSP